MKSTKTKGCCLIIALIFSTYQITFAQEKNPLINSGELIQEGTKLHEDGKYKEAVKAYHQINRSDTNYSDALYELSYSYYSDSQFNKSLEYAKLGQSLFPEKHLFSLQVANSLDELNREKEALEIFDAEIKKNPRSALWYFNRALVHHKLEKFDAAAKDLQQCLLINPYQASAHYFLGKIYLKQGHLVPAMLALKTYLLMAPSGKYFSPSIALLSDISKVTDEVTGYVKNKSKIIGDDFSTQEDILLSKISLDRKYKLKADLEDNIVRQIQVVDDKLEYEKNDKGFCMQYYVPFYTSMIESGQFEPLVFTMFSGVNNKDIENWNKKNKKEKQKFIDNASAYFDLIKATQQLEPAARQSATINFLHSGNYILGMGAYSKGKDPYAIGKWIYYYDNGQVKATGNLNNDGKKDGTWEYFYDNGQIKERSVFVNGELHGSSDGWFDNGSKWYTGAYKNGKQDGLYAVFFYNSLPLSTSYYKDGLLHGEQTYFDSKGHRSSYANYANDKLEGWARSFHTNGKTKNEIFYKDGKQHGTYKSYFTNGKLYLEGEVKEDLRQGLWTTYFRRGEISEKTFYVDNQITGEFTEYYPNGKLSRKGTYYRKKIDGKLETFDDDGKIYGDFVYDKGKLKEVNFYDKSGKAISTTTTRKGAANIIFYTPEGTKNSEGFFNKEGYKDGKYITYFESGKVREESYWKEGVQEGPQKTYFTDGVLKVSTNFKNGEEDGYFKEYFANGKLSSEGWRVEGNRQQNQLFYDLEGSLLAEEYYLDDDLNGYSRHYEGKTSNPSFEFMNKTGWITNIIQYDSAGVILSDHKLPKGSCTINYKLPNGKTMTAGSYQNYWLNGPYTYYYPDGSLSGKNFFKNGLKDSSYIGYHFGGKISAEGKYKDGNKDGTWKYYYENGKLMEEEYYEDGMLQGEDKIYNPDGSLDKILTYQDDNLHGPYKIFGEKNELAVQINYHYDNIKSYQYEIKPTVLCEPVMLTGTTGNVQAKYPNGKPSFQMNFIENDGEGQRKVYYSNGKIMSDGIRFHGYNNGLVKTYYPSGNIWREDNYQMGKLHGSSKVYHPNGKLAKEEFYYNNDSHGICKQYDDQGKLKQTLTYYYGALLQAK